MRTSTYVNRLTGQPMPPHSSGCNDRWCTGCNGGMWDYRKPSIAEMTPLDAQNSKTLRSLELVAQKLVERGGIVKPEDMPALLTELITVFGYIQTKYGEEYIEELEHKEVKRRRRGNLRPPDNLPRVAARGTLSTWIRKYSEKGMTHGMGRR